jgi:two-component system chemotaxis sensor kinase CheA
MINLDEAVQEFLIESRENLDQLDRDFVALEKEPGNRDKTSAIFRAVHTIKGTAGFLGFSHLEHLTHAGESLLSQVRDGTTALDADITSALLAMVDRVRAMLVLVESTGGDGDRAHDDIVARLQELRAARSPSSRADTVAATAVPPRTTDVPQRPPATPSTKPVAEFAPAETLAPSPSAGAERTKHPAETTTTAPIAASAPATIAATSTSATVKAGAATPSTKGSDGTASDLNVRVDVAVLDRLMNLVGELVLARNQLAQVGTRLEDQAFTSAAQRLSVITTELQESVMKTRMQPIGTVWSKLPRVVRDLAVQLGKHIRLEMVGQETELDRTVLEAVKDSLTHIVRNSVDHGIEAPEIRAAAGKPKTGTLTLRAFHEGGQVNVEISDDGAGINVEAVKKKGIERGLISADRAERMSEYELMQLIFVPGFSTADKVSNISGRGVGMDVVKTNVERLGGTVEVAQRLGYGTTLRIKIPLTLAIMPALIVASVGQRYAIPQVSLLELVRLRVGDADEDTVHRASGERDDAHRSDARVEWLQGSPFFRLRGELVPLVFLAEQLRTRAPRDASLRGHPSSIHGSDGAPLYEHGADVVVVKASGTLLGIVVDDVMDTEEIVVKPLGRELRGIDVFSGATIMGDGRVALILDVVGLARQCGAIDADGREGLDAAVGERGDEKSGELQREEQTLLLFSIAADEVMAIPLSSVARIEEFSLDAIERLGRRPVVQYRRGILPLLDLNHTALQHIDGESERRTVTVIVSAVGDKSVGLAVDSILDIVTDSFEIDRTAARNSVLGAAVVKGRVVEILDIHDAALSHAPTLLPRSAV